MKIPFFTADFGARLMSILPPEKAHNMTIDLLERGFAPKQSAPHNTCLASTVAGLSFPNPVGLAAGFDKNARVPNVMLGMGFGFVEVGAVTPKPQDGNAKPRVFRLREDNAVINRYGFNNDGLETIHARLAARDRSPGIVGINLGANKTSSDKTADYVAGIKSLGPYVDFCTVNISSPNTPGLRSLQSKDELSHLLQSVLDARHKTDLPVFLKIAPDLTDEDKTDIAELAISMALDGLIISNTTIERPKELTNAHAQEAGGLSGAPLMERSTRLVSEFYQHTSGQIPIIGVGGIASARDAYRKILAGASLVQLYTALIYHGPGLIQSILQELPDFLIADGFANISDAVGKQTL